MFLVNLASDHNRDCNAFSIDIFQPLLNEKSIYSISLYALSLCEAGDFRWAIVAKFSSPFKLSMKILQKFGKAVAADDMRSKFAESTASI